MSPLRVFYRERGGITSIPVKNVTAKEQVPSRAKLLRRLGPKGEVW